MAWNYPAGYQSAQYYVYNTLVFFGMYTKSEKKEHRSTGCVCNVIPGIKKETFNFGIVQRRYVFCGQ